MRVLMKFCLGRRVKMQIVQPYVCGCLHAAYKCSAVALDYDIVQFNQQKTVFESKGESNSLSSTQISHKYLIGCEREKRPLNVGVLLSGGVDSSVALALCKSAGHNCTAFYLQIWFKEDFRNFWSQCPWEEDLLYAKQVCEMYDVRLQIVPLTNEYWDRVVSHCLSEMKKGRTPNPDIWCNSRVKFGAFYDYITSQGYNFDRIASGHYAQVVRQKDDVVQLELSGDEIKDQTYFLAGLSQEQIQKTMFPIGPFVKSQVRQIAGELQLPNHGRKDSQGLCFLGKVKFPEFVKDNLGEWYGPIIDYDHNEIVGYHPGYWYYTTGQRSGIQLSGGPWYVVKRDLKKNVVYISRNYYSEDKERNLLRVGELNWISGHPPNLQGNNNYRCRTRHGCEMYDCRLHWEDDKQKVLWVKLDGNDQGLAPGQHCVFYLANICIGGGVMQEQFG